MAVDENVQRIHEKMLNDNAQAIAKFSEGFARLEQQFDGLNGWMKGIAKELREFVEKNDSKYQTKEMCEMCVLTGEKQYTELARIYEARISEMKDSHNKELQSLKESFEKETENLSNSIDKLSMRLYSIGIAVATLAISAIGTVLWFLIQRTLFGGS